MVLKCFCMCLYVGNSSTRPPGQDFPVSSWSSYDSTFADFTLLNIIRYELDFTNQTLSCLSLALSLPPSIYVSLLDIYVVWYSNLSLCVFMLVLPSLFVGGASRHVSTLSFTYQVWIGLNQTLSSLSPCPSLPISPSTSLISVSFNSIQQALLTWPLVDSTVKIWCKG